MADPRHWEPHDLLRTVRPHASGRVDAALFPNGVVAGPHSAAEMADALEHRHCRRADVGFANWLRLLLCEPPNPFQPAAPRRLRPQGLAVGGLLTLLLGLVVWFHATAPHP